MIRPSEIIPALEQGKVDVLGADLRQVVVAALRDVGAAGQIGLCCLLIA